MINRAILFFALLCVSFTAAAGPFNDKLSVCLVSKTTEADKTVLMRWIFAAMASHPGVKDLTTVSIEQGDKLNKEMAVLFMDLLSNRCKPETIEATKYEGATAWTSSFEVLGKVAMQRLLSDPNVGKYMGGLDAHLDPKVLKELLGSQPANP